MEVREKLLTEVYDIVHQLRGACNMYLDSAEDGETDEKLFDRLNEVTYLALKVKDSMENNL